MATHSSTLGWKIPWTEKPGGHSQWGCRELDRTVHMLAPTGKGKLRLGILNKFIQATNLMNLGSEILMLDF